VIAVAIIAAFALPSAFRARVVEVHGNATLGAAEVVAASLIVPGSPLFSNEATRIEAALAAWPPVSSAKASLVLPDRIRLDIVERKPVALAIAEAEGRNVLVAIDGTGMAYARVEGATLPELPVLSGIRFEEWKAGQRLPDFLLPTLESLATLESGDPGLLSLFSEIRVERSSFGELELILFPLHHPLPVRTKAALDPALLRSIVLILDALSTGGLAANVVELDFRTGTIVFRTKEGQPG
jgi:cell division protein FtsQ